MLLGRRAELDRLDGLLASLGRGLGFTLVLAGGIGAGKSALLDAVAQRSAAGQVLRAYGTPSESEVAFSGLSELAQPLLPDLAALPARQRETLRSVLALSRAALAADRPTEAVQRLAPAVELVLAGGVADPALIPCISDLIEAYAVCGRGDAAPPLAD
jgi:predicted ATPase